MLFTLVFIVRCQCLKWFNIILQDEEDLEEDVEEDDQKKDEL